METVNFNLRISEEINDKIVKIAKEEGRSKNKEIEYILKKYIEEYIKKENKNGWRNIY